MTYGQRAVPPAAPCPISWAPNALGPVFYGFQELGPPEGAPSRLRIFYPSLDGSPENAPILRSCGLYPLVIFVHGDCFDQQYQLWQILPAQLARAGYVVAIPEVPHGSNPSTNDAALDLLRALVLWIRSQWTENTELGPSTGLAGHSYGAMVGGRLAAEGSIAAYVSLSGTWEEWDSNGAPRPLRSIGCPTLFVWGGNQGVDSFTEISDFEWSLLSLPKHRAVFGADFAHWEYLPPKVSSCDDQRGSCPHAGGAAIDLVTMFFGRYIPPPGAPELPGRIPVSLIPPLLELTLEQEPFAGGFLTAYRAFEEASDVCQVELTAVTEENLLPLEFDPDQLQFGAVPVGSSRALDLTISNPNAADVAVSVFGASGSLFEWPEFNGMLPPGGGTTLRVLFTPADSAIIRVEMAVESNTVAGPQSVTLIGKGSGGFPRPLGSIPSHSDDLSVTTQSC